MNLLASPTLCILIGRLVLGWANLEILADGWPMFAVLTEGVDDLAPGGGGREEGEEEATP